MGKSSIISIILIVCIMGLIGAATYKKVYDNHKEALLLVSTKKIEEAANKCNLDEVCGDATTLGFLIEKGYLDYQVHPISKEFIDSSLAITCADYKCHTEVK